MHFENEPSTNWKRFVGTSSDLRVLYDVPTACVLLENTLTDFAAECRDNTITLDWTTVSQHNLDFFVVQKSQDGILFEDVHTVYSSGTISGMYDFVDNNSISGTVYYRLRLQDKNAQIAYSAISAVTCGNKYSNIIIAPNPASEILNIELNQEISGNMELILMNYLGKQIKNVQFTTQKGYNKYQLELTDYSAGSYILIVKGTGQYLVRRFVKK